MRTTKIFLSKSDSTHAAIQIIKGFHDLFSYAYEFWITHLSSSVADDTSTVYLDQAQFLVLNLLQVFQKDHGADNNPGINEERGSSHLTTTWSGSGLCDVSLDKMLMLFPETIRYYILARNGSLHIKQGLRKPLGVYLL